MRRLLWATLAFAASAVAGAMLGSPGLLAPEPADLDAASLDPPAGGRPDGAPRWQVGDAWNLKFGSGEPVCWIVVVAATEEGYRQGVWCSSDEEELIAAQIAGYDVRYLGNLSLDLAGRGDGEEVRFYDWPLADGKTWTTTYYGVEVEITSTYDAERGAWDLVMENGDDALLRYDYDPDVGWWTYWKFLGGTEVRVLDAVGAFPEPAVYAQARTAFDGARFPLAIEGPLRPVFDVAEEETVVLVRALRTGIYAHRLAVYDGEGNAVYDEGLAQNAILNNQGTAAFVSGAPGEWSMDSLAATTQEVRVIVRPIRFFVHEP